MRPGILDERREDDDDLALHILRDPFIGESQKHALLQVYRSFRAEKGGQLATQPGDA